MNTIESTLALLFGWPFVVMALGIFSITRLITTDSFPPIEKARNWFFDRFPHDGYTTQKRPNPKRATFILTGQHYYVNEGHYLGELVHCPWCMGWWVSLGACLSFWAWPIGTLALMVPFALRVIPGIIGSVID